MVAPRCAEFSFGGKAGLRPKTIEWDLSIGVSSPPVLVAPESPLPWVISALLVIAAIAPLVVAKLRGEEKTGEAAEEGLLEQERRLEAELNRELAKEP